MIAYKFKKFSGVMWIDSNANIVQELANLRFLFG